MVGDDQVDVMQLAHLAAAASSSASSTAYAVDAVVTEAVLFFAIMRSHVPAAALGQAIMPDTSEDAFKLFGQRVHADARAAAEACALAHQLVARDSDGGGGRMPADGGGAVASGVAAGRSGTVAAALAAGRVGAHADLTAATAREAAQLCMGILEDAVQASASPLARETAKRCAEQALRSIEAASVAEQHSRSLNELLARVMMSGDFQARAAWGAVQPEADALGAGAGGPGIPPAAPRMDVASKQRPRGTAAAEAAPAPLAASERPAQRAPPAGARLRWWAGSLESNSLVRMLTAEDAAPLAAASSSEPPPLAESAEQLEKYLDGRVRLCAEARPVSKGETDSSKAEDDRALRAAVEWRYGRAVALGCSEEQVLDDAPVALLACSRCSPDEAPHSAPLAAACRGVAGGAESLSGLAAVLQAAEEGRGDREAPAPETREEPLPYLGPFRQNPPETSLRDVEAGDWDAIFDRLGWMPSAPKAAQPHPTAGRPLGGSKSAPSPEAAMAGIAAWQAARASEVPEEPLEPEEGEYCLEALTLRQLHVMSMHSRSKQRRAGGAKQKAPPAEEGGQSAAAAAAAGPAPSQAAQGEDSLRELRDTLRELLGDWEAAGGDADSSAPGALGAEALARGCFPPPPGAAGGATGAAGPAAPAQASKRGGKKKKPLAAPGPAAGPLAAAPLAAAPAAPATGPPTAGACSSPRLAASEPAHVTGMSSGGAAASSLIYPPSPVHRLFVPPQLLGAGARGGEHQLGDEDELDDEHPGRDVDLVSSRDAPADEGLEGLARTYTPGQALLQQRLPWTFHESMEHIAVERREAYGVLHRGGLPQSAAWTPWAPRSTLMENRAQTFSEAVSSPVPTPGGTFIATPSWSHADAGEFPLLRKEDASSPLYVHSSPRRWASDNGGEEVSIASSGSGSAGGHRPSSAVSGPPRVAAHGRPASAVLQARMPWTYYEGMAEEAERKGRPPLPSIFAPGSGSSASAPSGLPFRGLWQRGRQ